MENTTYRWTDNPTVSGISQCDTDVLNECLMYLRYNIVSGRNIGDIFYTLRKESGSLNGAYDCTGIELSEADFEEGNSNPYTLLVNNILPWISYEDYDIQIQTNKGTCGVFALDIENHKFKTPTLKDIYIAAESASKIGDYITEGVPNISGGLRMINNDDSGLYGAFKKSSSTLTGVSLNLSNAGSLTFDASRSSAIYGASDTVRPKTICYRPMIQLANIINDKVSVESYTNRLQNKTDEGIIALANASNSLTQTNITGCLLSVPKRLKIDCSNNMLTIKAGSVATIPNGFEEDGTTPKFDYKELSSDIIVTYEKTAQNLMIALKTDNSGVVITEQTNCYSSDTAPETSTHVKFWYDKTSNRIKCFSTDTQDYSLISFPVCLANCIAEDEFEIKYIFDSSGYIDLTVWTDKDIKCLIPSGKNSDGSLNSINYIIPRCLTVDLNDNDTCIFIDSNGMLKADTDYDLLKDTHCYITSFSVSSNQMKYWKQPQVVELLKYNDIPKLSSISLPSERYINLTLGSTGTQYTAPDNGWVVISKNSSASNQYLSLNNLTTPLQINNTSTGSHGMYFYMPVSKGDVFSVGYNLGGSTAKFMFIYAKGTQ